MINNVILKLKGEKLLTWVEELFSVFPESDVYLVGGTIRDLLLGSLKADKIDYDFVVTGVSVLSLTKFLKEKGRVVMVGRRFGVIKFRPGSFEEVLDIALPRSERPWKYTGKRQDFVVTCDPLLPIEKDLLRRDFTINAMALSLRTGQFVDPHRGVYDLKRGLIRAVSSPKDRFQEDYSRMLRALRFALQLKFNIEKATFTVLKGLMSHINDTVEGGVRVVPYEIVAEEFLETFMADPQRALALYDESGALGELMPELVEMKGCEQSSNWHTEGDVWQHTELALKKLYSRKFIQYFPEPVDSELVMATLFHDLGKAATFYYHEKVGAQKARQICKRLRLTSARSYSVNCENLYWLVRNHSLILHASPGQLRSFTIEKYFFNPRYPGKTLLKLFLVDALSTIPISGKVDISRFEKLMVKFGKLTGRSGQLPKPLLTGHEIMRLLKIPSGPRIGEIQKALREEQLSGRVKTKREVRDYIKLQFSSTKSQ